MSRRFHDPQPFSPGTDVALGDSVSHHIGKVLRMRAGDAITLFNGHGGEYQATIQRIDRKAVYATIEGFNAVQRTPPLDVTVALPLIKGERMDYAIQKATELGAAAFQLLQCERSDVRLDAARRDRKLEHFRQVAISACEQCGMNRVPEIHDVQSLQAFVDGCSAGLKLIGQPGETALGNDLALAGSLALLTGPEGGFSDAERDIARAAGFRSFALGERVLRAETAPVALLAALWSRLP